MKNCFFIFLPLLFSVSVFADETLINAKKLFDSGSYFESEKLLKKYLEEHPQGRSKEINQVKAMLEFIDRNSPDYISNILKKYKDMLNDKTAKPDAILAEIPYGVMTLTYWKKNKIAEWVELSQILLDLLEHCKNRGTPDIAFKVMYHRAEIFALRGEMLKSIEILESAVSHYFPLSGDLGKLPAGSRNSAVKMYSLLGDVYYSIALQSNDKQEKIKYFSLAETVWLKIYPVMDKKTPLGISTIQKIQNCADSLSLLGYKVKLPNKFSGRKIVTGYPLIRKMIDGKRFSGAEQVIKEEMAKEKLTPVQKQELCFLCFFVLSKQSRPAEAVSFFRENKVTMPYDAFSLSEYLKAAEQMEAAGDNVNACALFCILNTMPYTGRDKVNILFSCANLSIKTANFADAMAYYEKAAELADAGQLQHQAYLQSAQCAEKIGNMEEAYRLAETALQIPVSRNIQIQTKTLHLHAAMKLKRYDSALSDAKDLLSWEETDPAFRSKILLTAAFLTAENNLPAETDHFLWEYLKENNDSPNFFSVLTQLKYLRLKKVDFEPMMELCLLAIDAHNEAEETYRLILETGNFFRKKKQIPNALKIYEMLLKINILSQEQLMNCTNVLSSADMQKCHGEANQLTGMLLAKNLKEYTDDPQCKELYFRMAKIYFQSEDYKKSDDILQKLLSEKKVYRAEDVMFLHGLCLDKQEQWEEAAAAWRKLLFVSGKGQRLEIIYHLANAEMKCKKYKNAVSTALLAIPVDGRRAGDEQTNQRIMDCLDILLYSAKECNLTEEYNEALKIKKQLER